MFFYTFFILGQVSTYAQSDKSDIQNIKKEIQKNWKYALELSITYSDSLAIICNRIDSLSKIHPKQFADYIIASNAIAVNNHSLPLKTLDYYLTRGETALAKYNAFLNNDMILHSKIMLTYQRCRFIDLQGNLEKALKCYEKVWYELPNEHSDKILYDYRNALPLSIALVYNDIGNFKRALDWLKVAEKYLNKSNPIYPGYLHNLKGQVNLSLAKVKEAENNFTKSIDCYLQSSIGKQSNHLITSYVDLSNTYLKQSNLEKAISILEEANLQLLETHFEFPLQYQFAKTYLQKGNLPKVLKHGRAALHFANKEKDGLYFLKNHALNILGEALAKDKKWSLALDTIQLALQHVSSNFTQKDWRENPELHTSNSKLDLLKTLVIKAEILAAYHQKSSQESLQCLTWSLQTYLHSIELIKILRAEYGDDEVKEYLSAQSFPIFEEALSVATQLYRLTNKAKYLDHAFSICEVSKACLLYTSPSPRDATLSRMPSSA